MQTKVMRLSLLLLAVVLAALPNESFSSPAVVGLHRTGGNQWDILFTGDVGAAYTLQETASLTSAWDDVESPFVCQPGTNVATREQSMTTVFWRLRGVGSSPQKLYITNLGDGTITVVNRIDRSVIGSMPVGTTPVLVGFMSGLNRAYVSDFGTNGIHVIDTATDTVLTTIALSRIVGSLDVDPVRRRVYALDHLETGDWRHGGTNLLVIAASNNTVIADIPVGQNVQDIRVDSGTGRAYFTDFVEGLKVFDSDSNTVVSTIPISGLAHGLAVDSVTGLVYVTQVESGTVSIVDLASNMVVSTVSVGGEPQWVALNAARTKAYVTNSRDGTVSVIDTASRTVASTIVVGAGAFYVVVDPDSGLAYVTNEGADTVSVIDTATDTVIETIATGNNPVGLALIQ